LNPLDRWVEFDRVAAYSPHKRSHNLPTNIAEQAPQLACYDGFEEVDTYLKSYHRSKTNKQVFDSNRCPKWGREFSISFLYPSVPYLSEKILDALLTPQHQLEERSQL
jgi:hypothetical protein